MARTDIDWIALDKGDIKVSTVVSQLMDTMEEYANYGFSVMEEKLTKDKGYFFSHRAFLDMFLEICTYSNQTKDINEKPEDI